MMGQGLKLPDNDGSGKGRKSWDERPPTALRIKAKECNLQETSCTFAPLYQNMGWKWGYIDTHLSQQCGEASLVKSGARLRNAFDIDIQKNFIREIWIEADWRLGCTYPSLLFSIKTIQSWAQQKQEDITSGDAKEISQEMRHLAPFRVRGLGPLLHHSERGDLAWPRDSLGQAWGEARGQEEGQTPDKCISRPGGVHHVLLINLGNVYFFFLLSLLPQQRPVFTQSYDDIPENKNAYRSNSSPLHIIFFFKSYLQTSLSFSPHLSRSSVPARSSASVSFTTRMSTFSRMSRP